jgi:GH35 family endo-1,4-beta-xylanase
MGRRSRAGKIDMSDPLSRPISRRQLLRSAAALAGVVVVAEACGSNTPSAVARLLTASPSPSPSPTPTPSPAATPTPHQEVLPSPTLRDLADRAKITVGTQIVHYGLETSRVYAEAATEVANMAMIEGELDVLKVFAGLDWRTIPKNWPSISATLAAQDIPYQDQLDFTHSDEVMAFAEQNGMKVYAAHLLDVHDMPSDLMTSGASKDELFQVVECFVKARVLKYKGRIAFWSAVNEAAAGRLYGDATYKFWYASSFSDELITNVFKWAHEADPAAGLGLNDNNVVETSNATFAPISRAFLALLAQLKGAGSPITFAGLEDHFWIYDPPSLSEMESVIRQIQRLGLGAIATETTVEMESEYAFWAGRPKTVSTIPDKLSAQAKIYWDTLKSCVDTKSVFGMFGFSDAISMFDSGNIHIPDAQGLILDASYQPKPAYSEMAAYLEGLPVL